MSAPDIVANMARGWNRQPAGVAVGTERTGISAALWTHDGEDVQEVHAEPMSTHHIVCLQAAPCKAEWVLDGKRQHSGKINIGRVCIVPAGLRPWAAHRGRFRCLHLYVPDAILSGIIEAGDIPVSAGSLELIDPRCAHDLTIEQVGRDVLAEIRAHQPLSRLRIDALGQELAIHLLRAHSNLAGTHALSHGPPRGGLAPWQVGRVKDYLLTRQDQDVALTELAAIVDLSPYHFARAFKASTGLPPHRYQMTMRVERAKDRLAHTGQTITEIAHACGFASSQHLATVFRRLVGTTPSDYRRERHQ